MKWVEKNVWNLKEIFKIIKNMHSYQGSVCACFTETFLEKSNLWNNTHYFCITPLQNENMPTKLVLQITEFPDLGIQWCKF